MAFQGKFKIVDNIADAAIAINEAHEKVPDLVPITTVMLDQVAYMDYMGALNLRQIHGAMFPHLGADAGSYRTAAVISFLTCNPISIPEKMERFAFSVDTNPMESYNEFQRIHPFLDGNGRVGGVALATISMKMYGFMIVPDGI